jgi:hypothetical protein
MPIGKAKKVAMAMSLDPGIGKVVSNPIDRLYEIVQTDDLDRVRKYHRDVPGDQSRQKLGGKNRP